MKNIFFPFFFGTLLFAFINCETEGFRAKTNLKTSLDSMYYSLGANYGIDYVEAGIPLNGSKIRRGYWEASTGKTKMELKTAEDLYRRLEVEFARRNGEPFTDKDPIPMEVNRLSYAMGRRLYSIMEKKSISLDHLLVANGLGDSFTKEDCKLSKEQVRIQMNNFDLYIEEQKRLKRKALANENTKKGMVFINEKIKEEGVLNTASGLYYKILKEGKGEAPKPSSEVAVHYEGRLTDGTIFDSSYKQGEPVEFLLNGVIAGWREGLQLMVPGAKFQFYIPPALAYGSRGFPPDIGPNETLIYDIELLEIK